MSPETAGFLPLVLASPLLAAMAYGDLRRLRISNRLVLAMVAVFVLCLPLLQLPEIGLRVAAATAIYFIGAAGFALGLWSGGDVKALSALMLLMPSSTLMVYAYVFSASMVVGLALVLSLRTIVGSPESAWSSLRPRAGFPMGVSIALSGLLLPPAVILVSLQFTQA